jgi:hypothetical protein
MQNLDLELELLNENGLVPIISNQINMNIATFKVCFPSNLSEKNINEVEKLDTKRFLAKPSLIGPLVKFFTSNNDFINQEKNENIKKMQLAFLITAYFSNCIKIEFQDYLKENQEKYEEKTDEKEIKFYIEIASLIPTCINAINISTINFIRFNHHFPKEKRNLIKKAFLNVLDTYMKDIIPENDEEDLSEEFYEKIVPLIKIINEFAFFNLFIKEKKEENKNLILEENKRPFEEITVLSIGEFYNLRINQPIIMIRNSPTTNGFLILDLLDIMVEDFKNKKFLPFIPYKEEIKILLNLREELINDPFANHPSRNYFKYKKSNFNENYKKLTLNLEKLGNLIYLYCKEGSKSLKQAKSCLKYGDLELPTNKNLILIFNEAFNNLEINVEEIKKYVNENLKKDEITKLISEKKDLVEENEKYYEYVKSIKKEIDN